VIASYIRENDNYDEKTFNGIKYLNNKQTTNISFDVLHEIVKECINNKDSCKNYFVNHKANGGKIYYESNINYAIVKKVKIKIMTYDIIFIQLIIRVKKIAHQFVFNYNTQTKKV
jgi:hypothetical protein